MTICGTEWNLCLEVGVEASVGVGVSVGLKRSLAGSSVLHGKARSTWVLCSRETALWFP